MGVLRIGILSTASIVPRFVGAAGTIHVGYLYGEKGYVELPDYWKAR